MRSKTKNAYQTIGEVAKILSIESYVLRFWESKFNQLKPMKNRGRRYYSPNDIALLKEIKSLLYEQKFTVEGVKQYLINKKRTSNVNIYNKFLATAGDDSLQELKKILIELNHVQKIIKKSIDVQ